MTAMLAFYALEKVVVHPCFCRFVFIGLAYGFLQDIRTGGGGMGSGSGAALVVGSIKS